MIVEQKVPPDLLSESNYNSYPDLRFDDLYPVLVWCRDYDISIAFVKNDPAELMVGVALGVIGKDKTDKEFEKWCREYYRDNYLFKTRTFKFINPEQATLFKLTWC